MSIPLGFCACGCGERTVISKHTRPQYGNVRGQYYRFKGGHQRRLLGTKSYPGRGVRVNGQTKAERLHRIVAERALGKPLPRTAHVHHVDGSKSMASALVICEGSAYHWLLHIRQRVKDAGGDPNTERVCRRCQSVKPINAFAKVSGAYCEVRAICRMCVNEQQRVRHAKRRAA